MSCHALSAVCFACLPSLPWLHRAAHEEMPQLVMGEAGDDPAQPWLSQPTQHLQVVAALGWTQCALSRWEGPWFISADEEINFIGTLTHIG